MSDLLNDANGHKSSKRVAGFAALMILAFISIYALIKDPSTISIIVWPWTVISGGLLGVSVLEKKL